MVESSSLLNVMLLLNTWHTWHVHTNTASVFEIYFHCVHYPFLGKLNYVLGHPFLSYAAASNSGFLYPWW